MPRRKKPKKPTHKRRSILDWIIYKMESWLYDQEQILQDSKTKSQIFNNMANVQVKQSQVALNKEKLKTLKLQNKILTLTIENAKLSKGSPTTAIIEGNKPIQLSPPNASYCPECQVHHPATRSMCTCGLATVPDYLEMRIGENYGK